MIHNLLYMYILWVKMMFWWRAVVNQMHLNVTPPLPKKAHFDACCRYCIWKVPAIMIQPYYEN